MLLPELHNSAFELKFPSQIINHNHFINSYHNNRTRESIGTERSVRGLGAAILVECSAWRPVAFEHCTYRYTYCSSSYSYNTMQHTAVQYSTCVLVHRTRWRLLLRTRRPRDWPTRSPVEKPRKFPIWLDLTCEKYQIIFKLNNIKLFLKNIVIINSQCYEA